MKTLTLLLLLSVGLIGQTVAFPATPKGEFAKRYVDAFNTGESAMREFLAGLPAGGPPLEDRIARYRQVQQDLGSIVPTVPPREVPEGIEMLSKNRHGDLLRLAVIISDTPPFALGGLRAQPADQPGGPPVSSGAPLDARTMTANVKAIVESRVKADVFSGAVLIARGPDVVWQGPTAGLTAKRSAPSQ